MISYLKGKVISIDDTTITLENSGIGYEITMTENDAGKLKVGETVEIYVINSFSMYEGMRLYGFLSNDDKKLFELIKKTIPNTGNSKTMEYLNKIQRSVSDFKKAVIKGDEKVLKQIFGFSPKASKNIISFLRDKIKDETEGESLSQSYLNYYDAAVNALVNLGYKTTEARNAVSEVLSENREKRITLEEVVKLSLRKLSAR